MKGRAVVFKERLQVAYEEVDIPAPGPDDVLIDLEYSWISIGTESSFLRGERISGDVPYRNGNARPFPQVCGYQKVGKIRRIGANVAGLAVGDRVFATTSKVNGMFFPDGGHVNPAVTAASEVWKLPDGADPLAYSGLVLTQVGYNCGVRPSVKAGELAVVIGDGLVGQWAAQTLARRGARTIVLGRHDDRLKLLPPAIAGINVRSTPPDKAIADEIAVIVDSVGSLETVKVLFPLAGHDTHIVSAGFYGEAGLVDIQWLRHKETTLHMPAGWTRPRMDATLAGITEGWLTTLPLVTHTFPARDAVAAWQVILDPSAPKLGVILEWEQAT